MPFAEGRTGDISQLFYCFNVFSDSFINTFVMFVTIWSIPDNPAA
jgi:hypothetical protein